MEINQEKIDIRMQHIMEFSHGGLSVPGYMVSALAEYIEIGRGVGDFLTAVLQNNLKGAVSHADDANGRRLQVYIIYLHNYAPAACSGSVEMHKAWITRGGMQCINEGSAA